MLELMQMARRKEFWEVIRSDSMYRPIISEIQNLYNKTHYEQIPTLGYSSRMRFDRDGDRAEFEALYFRRRSALSASALLALIYPEEPKYVHDLQEIIWAICEEYCWVIPAHIKFSEAGDNSYIDLFAAETGFALAEISSFLQDRIDGKIYTHIRETVERRILTPFLQRSMNWEATSNNWAAVCAGNVGGALMYLFPEKLEAVLPRLIHAMQNFLSGYSDEGICYEGLNYWNYGFGNFTWFADLLMQFTDGRVDLMDDPKAEVCAGYAQRVFLKGNTIVSFADCSRSGTADFALQNYLSKRYPKTIGKLPIKVAKPWGGNMPWTNYLRNLCYFEEVDEDKYPLRSFDQLKGGQVIVNQQQYSLAVKAGNNDECRGHNDVGTFILSTDQGQVFCDLGSGTYTRDYFDDSTRYQVFCVGSMGHSVPIINGQFQKHGKEFSGTICHDDNRIELEISGAYGQPEFRKLKRTFLYFNDWIELTDAFEQNYESLTERFITLMKPEQKGNRIFLGGVILEYDSEKGMPLIHAEENSGGVGTVFCIDFIIKKGLTSVSFTFRICTA